MSKLLLAGLLCLASAAPLPAETQPPDPVAVERAVARLGAAFDDGDVPERIEAMKAAAGLPDAETAQGVARGLKDRDEAVVRTAVDVLGRMQHTEALELLEAYTKKNKKRLQKDPGLFVEVLKSCARHGQASSIGILDDDPFSVRSPELMQARIYGLGNIRTKESAEAILGLARKTGRRKLARTMQEVRIALFNVTGVDQGKSYEQWDAWWRKHEKTFVIPKDPPEMPPDMRGTWNRFWGIEVEAKAKRERRNG